MKISTPRTSNVPGRATMKVVYRLTRMLAGNIIKQ